MHPTRGPDLSQFRGLPLPHTDLYGESVWTPFKGKEKSPDSPRPWNYGTQQRLRHAPLWPHGQMPLAVLPAFETQRPKWRTLGGGDSRQPSGVQRTPGLLEQKHLVAPEAKTRNCEDRLTGSGSSRHHAKHKDGSSPACSPREGRRGRPGLQSHMVSTGSRGLLSYRRAVTDQAPGYHPRPPKSQKLLRTHAGFRHTHGHEIRR